MIATQLLSLRDIGRIKPSKRASHDIESLEIKVIHHFYQLTYPLTVQEFWRRIAMLGGFLGRKSDGGLDGKLDGWVGCGYKICVEELKLVIENI